MQVAHETLPRVVNLIHQFRRNPVVRLAKSPFQCHFLAVARLAAIARRPVAVGALHVQDGALRRVAALHRHGIDKGFHRRAHLPAAHGGHVVLEMSVVQSAHIGFHVSRFGVNGYEAGAQEALVIAYGVARRHQRVHFAARRVHRHRHAAVERLFYFRLRSPVGFHLAITVALLHGLGEALVHVFHRKGRYIGRIGRAALFSVKLCLHHLPHLLLHGLLGVLLHTRVDGRIYFKPVGVNVVVRAVALHVLLAPAVERVVLPHERIHVVLRSLPSAVIVGVGAFRHHDAAQVFAQIGGKAFLVVDAVEVEPERFLAETFHFFLREVSRLAHLLQHHVAPLAATLRLAHRIKVRGVFTHAHQRGGFERGEVARLFAEIYLRRRFDAYGIVQEVEIIKVKREDFLFCVSALQFHGDYPFYGLLQQSLHRGGCRGRIELLGQLLRDGAAAARAFLPENAAFHHGARQGFGINARVVVETHVLRCCERVEHHGRNAVVVHEHAVLVAAPRAEQFAIGGEDLRSVAADGALQLVNRRHVANPPFVDRHERERYYQQCGDEERPHPNQEFLSHSIIDVLFQ